MLHPSPKTIVVRTANSFHPRLTETTAAAAADARMENDDLLLRYALPPTISNHDEKLLHFMVDEKMCCKDDYRNKMANKDDWDSLGMLFQFPCVCFLNLALQSVICLW